MAEPTTARARDRRVDEFFHTARALAWFPFVAAGMLLVRRGKRLQNVRAQVALFAWALVTLAVWCLMLFLPHSAAIQHGSFAVLMTLYVLCAIWADSGGPVALLVLLALEAMTFVTTYAVPNAHVSGPANGIACVMAGAGALLIIVARGVWTSTPPRLR